MKVKSFLNFSQDSSYKFELVDGDEIIKWYPCRNKKCLDIFTDNPEKCKLLILLNNNKLIAYSLIWGPLIRPIDAIFMDTIHSIEESDEVDFFIFGDPITHYFENYANKNNWLYKDNDFDTYSVRLKIKDNVFGVGSYEFFPKMDKLKFYNPSTGRLSSDKGIKPSEVADKTQYLLDKEGKPTILHH